LDGDALKMRGFSKDLGNRVVKRCISISPREMRRSLTLRGQGNLKGNPLYNREKL